MFQVVSPNSTENSTFTDFCSLKIIQPPEYNPSQQHKSAKQLSSHSQTHLMPLIKGFISCTRCDWARTHKISELVRLVSHLPACQKYVKRKAQKVKRRFDRSSQTRNRI